MKIIPSISVAAILLAISVLASAWQVANSLSDHAASQSKAPAKTSKALPPGEGRQLIVKHCSHCHALTVVTRERRTRDDWISEIQSMASKGMDADPDQMLVILNYLSKNFGPAKTTHKNL